MTARTSFRPFARALPVLGIAALVAPLASGCELFVHFDRSRIGAGDASIDSGPPVDSNVDAGHDAGADAFAPDTGMDAGNDAFVPVDMGTDAFHFDTGTDTGCQGIADCPVTGNECVVPTCTAGLCGTMNLDNSHVVATQTPDDCQQVVCDGNGGTTTVALASDHPASTECDTISCNGTTVMHTPQPTTTTCGTGGGMVCDGAGSCVDCNTAAQCATASCVGTTHHAAETCNASHMCAAGGVVDCSATGQVCSVSAGCVQCVGAADCMPASCVGTVYTTAESCNGSHTCVAGTSTDCAATTQVCNTAAGCVQCNSTADCVTGTCNTTSHLCE